MDIILSFVLGALGAVPVLVIHRLFSHSEQRQLIRVARELAAEALPPGGPAVPSGPVTDALVARVVAETKASIGKALLEALGVSR